MKHAISVLVSSCLALSGCSAVRVSSEPVPGEPASLLLKAVDRRDPESLSLGYTFHIQRNDEDFGSYPSFQDRPTLAPPLLPGWYLISLEGKDINPRKAWVEIRDGHRTTVELFVEGARLWTIAEYAGACVAGVIVGLLALVLSGYR